jgi:hypothetical protein
VEADSNLLAWLAAGLLWLALGAVLAFSVADWANDHWRRLR